MDTKLLYGEAPGASLGIEVLLSIASKKRKREYFFRSLLRCILLTLLFIAFGCFFAIYEQEKGRYYSFFVNAVPFDFRSILKELFTLSLIPSICFLLCWFLNGKLCRLCDTLFPAIYGTLSGVFYYSEIMTLSASFSVSNTVKLLPYICSIFLVIVNYTLFCPVCASFGECRRRKTAAASDGSGCFTYYLISLTALALCIVMRDSAVLFFRMFG